MPDEAPPAAPPSARRHWAAWMLGTWTVLVILVAVAEACGLLDLRLALDFDRHLPMAPRAQPGSTAAP